MPENLALAEAHIEGLLHLGALAIAITAAYVGLDRIKVENDEFSKGLDKIKNDVRTYITNTFDIKCDQPFVMKRSVSVRAVIVLCYIAYARVKTPWWTRPVHFLLRHWHAPFYRYFSSRHDTTVMIWSCLFSLFTFLYLVFLQSFDWNVFNGTHFLFFGYSINLIRVLFVIYTAIIVFAFISVMISSRLKLAILQGKCTRLYELAGEQRKKVATDLLAEAMEFGGLPPNAPDGT